ncbi:F0F1 ATP synthase subunit B [Candidatus Uabimicrobium amorphum]|uniref:ATP synthase subunit b n=1 Tax=Uabimicrobium amorphum TaxID=2596890 RepID=A0A5S9F159_UABAM|nr:F0F1 ATP synthase subunit B [Candidatus Uabimicrobium amorphum]BBM82267.1 ATP synthase subunit b [Candidatus Uabimicrobium amorphum]
MSILTRNLGKIMIILMLVIPNTVLMASGDGAQITKLEKGLMFWSLVTFFIVFLILSKVAWKPLIAGLEQRENTIRGNIEDAEKKQKEAAQKLQEYEEKLSKAEDEVKAIFDSAKTNAEQIKKEMIAEANKECDSIRARAENDIKLAKQQAVEEVFKTAADISIAISTKLIQESLDEKKQAKIIEDTLKTFEDLKTLN